MSRPQGEATARHRSALGHRRARSPETPPTTTARPTSGPQVLRRRGRLELERARRALPVGGWPASCSRSTRRLSGRPQVANDAVLEFAAENADMALAFVSLDPHRGDEAVREARRLIARGGVRGLKLHPPLQQFFPNDRSPTRSTRCSRRRACRCCSTRATAGSARGCAAAAGSGSSTAHRCRSTTWPWTFPTCRSSWPTLPSRGRTRQSRSACTSHRSTSTSRAGRRSTSADAVQHANTLLKTRCCSGRTTPSSHPIDGWRSSRRSAIRDEVRPLILKDNAARLLGLVPARPAP